MKKIILSLLCSSILVLQNFAHPLFSRKTSGGLFGGYWETSKELVTNSEGKSGWVIDCKNPGFTSCPNASKPVTLINEPVLELNDYNAINSLLEQVDPLIGNGHPGDSGNETLNISVEGESFIRIYRVTWTVNEDGSTYTSIDREDVQKN